MAALWAICERIVLQAEEEERPVRMRALTSGTMGGLWSYRSDADSEAPAPGPVAGGEEEGGARLAQPSAVGGFFAKFSADVQSWNEILAAQLPEQPELRAPPCRASGRAPECGRTGRAADLGVQESLGQPSASSSRARPKGFLARHAVHLQQWNDALSDELAGLSGRREPQAFVLSPAETPESRSRTTSCDGAEPVRGRYSFCVRFEEDWAPAAPVPLQASRGAPAEAPRPEAPAAAAASVGELWGRVVGQFKGIYVGHG